MERISQKINLKTLGLVGHYATSQQNATTHYTRGFRNSLNSLGLKGATRAITRSAGNVHATAQPGPLRCVQPGPAASAGSDPGRFLPDPPRSRDKTGLVPVVRSRRGARQRGGAGGSPGEAALGPGSRVRAAPSVGRQR